MNGLTLRISSGGNKKSRNTSDFNPVVIPHEIKQSFCELKGIYENFVNSDSANKQLDILKNLSSSTFKSDDLIKFLVILFLEAQAKHPVKCFVTRYVTKNTSIQKQFAEMLAVQIESIIQRKSEAYNDFLQVVSKLATCFENFPTGVEAVKIIEVAVADYLKCSLGCCVRTLRESQALSPTEKTEMYNLAHLSVRLLLHILQKCINNNTRKFDSMFCPIRELIEQLLLDVDAPMDTKSVCAKLYLIIYILENGTESWRELLQPNLPDVRVRRLLDDAPARLALLSAVATTVPGPALVGAGAAPAQEGEEGPAAVSLLLDQIIRIGDCNPSEPTVSLGVSRAVLQLSRALRAGGGAGGAREAARRALAFAAARLDHSADSVRHLAAQALAHLVRYSAHEHARGDGAPLDEVFATLGALDRGRRGHYAALAALAAALGAGALLARAPGALPACLRALADPALQASATSALETMLATHVPLCSTQEAYSRWVEPLLQHAAEPALEAAPRGALARLLGRAVALDPALLHLIYPKIMESDESNLQYTLLVLGVVRGAGGAAGVPGVAGAGGWARGLRRAALHPDDETRLQALALAAESPRSTQLFLREELELVRCFLRYNINAQSPNFRQQTLALLKKFTNRFEDSYKVLLRQTEPCECGDAAQYYKEFVGRLRAQCFASLLPDASYSRRHVALRLLRWAELADLPGCTRPWREEYVERLLQRLEDSYESNKELALEVLSACPDHLLRSNTYSVSLELSDIIAQASSLSPAECASAACKLQLVARRLPDRVLAEARRAEGDWEPEATPCAVWYAALAVLRRELRAQLAVCARSVVEAAARAPVHGLLLCAERVLASLDPQAIARSARWRAAAGEVWARCEEALAAAAPVVCSASPEGHLPLDGGGAFTDHGNSAGVTLPDGRLVTAQAVLLCAWRCVKEASLLLGTLCSRLTVEGEGEGEGGTLLPEQLRAAGERFTRLLAETKHRGAFEQAYVGFTRLLARLWRCRSPALHSLPRAWLRGLLAALGGGGAPGALCATRRSAGLPFMIQALVTTEQEVDGSSPCFHECVRELLRLARPGGDGGGEGDAGGGEGDAGGGTTRAHAANILRALFRHSALDESVARYVEDGFVVALLGFDGDTWQERNSSTLLFSALMSRALGVRRSNTMTGRVFSHNYPALYGYMLKKLEQICETVDKALHPSLFPILLLLSRLYPSALEGTVSNVKLCSFAPLVGRCARGAGLRARALAAAALRPLVAHTGRYIPHIEETFELLRDTTIKRNHCHGLLLQLSSLLDGRPEGLALGGAAARRLAAAVRASRWLLEQAAPAPLPQPAPVPPTAPGTPAAPVPQPVPAPPPCYPLADEYLKVINLLVFKFPCVIDDEFLIKIQECLNKMLFTTDVPTVTLGRELCLANAFYLQIIVCSKLEDTDKIIDILYKCLAHECYEVVLNAMNYLLLLQRKLDTDDCGFIKHLRTLHNENVLRKLRLNSRYVDALCTVLRDCKYAECKRKSLELLTLERDTERRIVEIKLNKTQITDETTIRTLVECVDSEHESTKHIYLECLANFALKRLRQSKVDEALSLDILGVMFACSSAESSEQTRAVVVGFLQAGCEELVALRLAGAGVGYEFAVKSYLVGSLAVLLQDEAAALRQRTADLVVTLTRSAGGRVVAARAGELLAEWVAEGLGEAPGEGSAAALLLLALLDFRCGAGGAPGAGAGAGAGAEGGEDDDGDWRVFGPGERRNAFLEECAWGCACAGRFARLCAAGGARPEDVARALASRPAYGPALRRLGGPNLTPLLLALGGAAPEPQRDGAAVHPKVKLIVDRIRAPEMDDDDW